jgi:aspartate racemase
MANVMNPANDKVIGILGVAPHATQMFLRNILDLSYAGKDWDHIRTVCDTNTHMPSRSRAILFGEESPLPAMLDSCKRLQNYPVDLIVIPCNSACHWIEPLQREVKTPIVNIARVAAEALLRDARPSRVTVLGTMVPYLTDLYRKEFESPGVTYVKPSEANQATAVDLIERIKRDGTAEGLETQMAELIARLVREDHVDGIVLGCTEFTEFKHLAFDGVRLVDSSSALAQMVVDYALHGRPLPVDLKHIEGFWRQRAAQVVSGELGILQATLLTASEAEAVEKDEREKAALLKVLKPMLDPQGSLLEVGCGHGRWSRTLAQHVRHVDAYDYAPDLIELARSLSHDVPNVTYTCAPVQTLTPERPYDYVVSIGLLLYLDHDQFSMLIEMIRRSLKPGGLAIFREPLGFDHRFELHGFYSNVLGTEYHAVYRTVKELAEQMNGDFTCIHEEMSLPPTAEKPETCQRIVIFRKNH